ncbi:MAG: Rnf-Nqr domain containing protein [Ruthenibacterium sp.]
MTTQITEVLSACATFFLYAVMAVFAQNVIFTRALGVSRLVKLVDDDNVDSMTFGLLLCAVQMISAPMAYFANLLLVPLDNRAYLRPLVFVLCSGVAFFIVLLLVAVFLRKSGAKEIIAVLPMATFNCSVLGTMLIATTQSFSFLQTMGFALGTGIGYVLAVLVVTEGQRKLQNRSVPAPFRGLPITLLYIGVLAVAIYGFTGHMMAF